MSNVKPDDVSQTDAALWAVSEIVDALAVVPADRRVAVVAAALALSGLACALHFPDQTPATEEQ